VLFRSKVADILAWLEVKTVDDIDLDKMADLLAAQNTAKEENVPLAEIFSRRAQSNPADDIAPKNAQTGGVK
jgi:hypothetical protein